MPYDRRHVLAQWGGTLPGGEIWSNSVRLAGGSAGAGAVPDQPDLISWLEGPAKDAVATFHQAPTSNIHRSAKLTFLKLNVIRTDGRYEEATTHEYVYSPAVPGAGTLGPYPNQVALVVSLVTAVERGYAHRGRFYLPSPTTQTMEADGRIQLAAANDVALSAATFLSALHDQPGPDLNDNEDVHVCVMSAAGTGATNRVIAVEVGRVLDTQRRRRTELPEEWQRSPLV